MQRLFSAFPSGGPGVGLILLRAALGFTLLAQGASYLSAWPDLTFVAYVVVFSSVASGVSLLIGFLTPLAGILAVLSAACTLPSWLAPPPSQLFDSKLLIINVIVMAGTVSFLGPGAFSLDARLFGRREIIIPSSSSSKI